MRSMRFAAALCVLVLVAAACSDDENGEEEPSDETTTTTTASAGPTTTQALITTPTTAPEEAPTTTVVEVSAPTTSTTAPPVSTGVGPPTPPSNVRCQAGNADNELLVEFDALPSPADVAKIRVYVSVDGGPMITNGEYTLDQIDTTRSGGDRWAARARSVPPNAALRLAVTSFNQLGQESGWYIVEAQYVGSGQACGAPLPPPVCTAGCDEEGEQGEGEQGV